MNYRAQFILVLITLSTVSYAQQQERRGKFFFNIGPEFRITPIYNAEISGISAQAFDTNMDLQNSGVALNVGVDYYLTEKFALGFNNSFRNDLITNQSSSNEGVEVANKGLLIGSHFRLTYHIDLFKKGDLLLGLGHSLLNRNSEYTAVESFFDENGNAVGSSSSLENFNYSATKITVGYGNGRSKLMCGMYLSRNSPYLIWGNFFMVPFLSYGFDFGRL
ncbi:hypothetical protein [Poritiphilus flavus]|uniref:Outer membrane protein beta-barrel domain-containing protein n=1 Tax=Poritiphilus flavus TaxID=2697053 RepID=A0A6L9EC67_9FLAO|nr:hypothetical protein [Poritiphilus flavus]NAS12138.1 hypothetical protein [Poritiphilus flavus]